MINTVCIFIHRYISYLKTQFVKVLRLRPPGVGLFNVDFCPGDQGLHQVSHHQKVNAPAIPKEREGGGGEFK